MDVLKTANELGLTKKDFESDQDVRWCPGCGDYAILSVAQKVMPTLNLPKEKFVFISGIGCSSRLPYYMNTYGFHTIHGRAPTIATGIKSVNPDLSVWVVTGDGDALSIGGNHLLHVLRRNVDLNIILVNNRIYGLTKGQYSPTSEVGKKTKSSPMGVIDNPINPLCVAIASEATFVARTLDTDLKHMSEIFYRAAQHKGSSFIEIYQNCIIFNDEAFKYISDREVKSDRAVYLEHNQPLIFGAKKDKAIRLNGLKPEVVNVADVPREDILVHNEKYEEPTLAYLLTQLDYPEFPVPLGIFRCVEKPSYEQLLQNQIDAAVKAKGPGDLKSLFYESYTWAVE